MMQHRQIAEPRERHPRSASGVAIARPSQRIGRRHICLSALFVLTIGTLVFPSLATAEEAADLMPPSTIAVAHVDRVDQLVALVLDHPLRSQIEEIDAIKEGLASDQFTQFQAGLQLAEFRIGMKWPEALKTLTEGGVTVAFDAETQGVVLLAKTNNQEALEKLIKDVTDFVRGVAPNADAFETGEYRGVTAYQVDEAVIASFDSWLMVSNNNDLAKSIVDRHLDGGSCLADKEQYGNGIQQLSDSLSGWAWLDVATLRDAGAAAELFESRSENIAVEFLVGGIQDALKETDYATLGFHITQEAIELELASPFDSEWIQEPREFFFGKNASGRAPAPLEPQGTIFSALTYRDIGSLWLAKEDLFEENHIAELTLADSNLSTLFAGVDFGEEVLGAAEPGFQVIVTRQDFTQLATPVPAIKLPAFAFVFELKEPKEVQRQFKVAYQSLIGFVNIGLGQQGQPQLEFDTETIDGARMTSATYFADPDEDEGRINYNFSPSISFPGNYFVLSSTRELAHELTTLIQSGTYGQPSDANTFLHLEGNMLAETLGDNRDQLIANNMLEEGNDIEAAEAEIDILLQLVDIFDSFSAEMGVGDGHLNLSARLAIGE